MGRRFQPSRVRRFAEVMGTSADVVTHSHYRSYTGIAVAYRKHHKQDIGYNTIGRYVRLLEEAGIISVERRKWGPATTTLVPAGTTCTPYTSTA